MKREVLKRNVRYFLFQRNIFLALTALLACSLVVQSLFLFSKQERVVIVPSVVERSFWVERGKCSPTYLEEIGLFLAGMLLSKSASSLPSQREVVLRHADPSFATTIRKKLLEEEELLKRQNASYVFFTHRVSTDMKKMEVLVEGDRLMYVSGSRVSSQQEGYILSFAYSGGRVLLTGIRSKDGRCD
jgi:conjugal transfer pilus assembly protein TraE